jgi:hypothetical protein
METEQDTIEDAIARFKAAAACMEAHRKIMVELREKVIVAKHTDGDVEAAEVAAKAQDAKWYEHYKEEQAAAKAIVDILDLGTVARRSFIGHLRVAQ